MMDENILARHRPGQRQADQAGRDASERAREAMIRQAEDAWMNEAQRRERTERRYQQALDEVLIRDAEARRFAAWKSMVARAESAWKTRP